jgi:hypothetical protein
MALSELNLSRNRLAALSSIAWSSAWAPVVRRSLMDIAPATMPVATTGKQPGSARIKKGSINKTGQVDREAGNFTWQGS